MAIFAVKTTASQERTGADMIINREEPGIYAVLAPDQLTSYVMVEADDMAPIQRVLDRYTIDTHELREIAMRDDGLVTYGSAGTLAFDEPRCSDRVPDALALKVGRHRSPQPFVAELRNAELVGSRAVTVAPDGRFVLDTALCSDTLLVRDLAATLREGVIPRQGAGTRDTEPRFETAVSLVGPWCRGYFHWFSEWLPRLEGVVRYERQTGRIPTVLLPPDPPQWLSDSVRLAGFDPDRCVEWSGPGAAVDRLVVPSIRRALPADDSRDGYTNAPEGYRWVRETILGNLDRDPPAADRIYVSRSAAEERRVVNEEAVVAALDSRGFEPYALEELSFPEQVALFAGAEAVVGPHGAGLVNAIYGDDLAVVELFGDYENACYFTMAEGLGFEYACMACDPVGAHLRVDVDELLGLVDRVLDP